MNRTKVKLQIQKTGVSPGGLVLMLNESIVGMWTVPIGQPLKLCFGSASQEVMVESSSQGDVLLISAALASKWGLIHGDELSVQYQPSTETLQIGPIIGVMLSHINRKKPSDPFGVNSSFCRELIRASKLDHSIVFFFTHADIQRQSNTINGWRYTHKWVRNRFPIPNVIYNRVTSRKLESLASVKQFINYAKSSYNTLFFNEKYLNKTEVFQALKQEPELHVYLPESYLLSNFEMLKKMCSKHNAVFLKPNCGSLGKGIIRINRNANTTYTCHFSSFNGVRQQSFASIEKLFNFISSKMRKNRYQIQRGLNLLSVGSRPVDFRALVQLDETGQWGITSIVARIAGNQQFVSNQARGGTVTTVRAALARTRAAAASGGLAKLRQAALQIAKGIETQLTGHFAELGIDLAIDTQGQVWLIEVNSKPSKNDRAPLSSTGKIRPSVTKFVQYANYAAKMSDD